MRTRTHPILRNTAALLLGALTVKLAVSALAGVLPGHSDAFGRGLAEWQETYWSWALGAPVTPVGEDAAGNPAVGTVVLMPLPDAPGDGTPGSIDVTLRAGSPFFLPLFAWVGTSYTTGDPPDTYLDPDIFRTMDITLKVDGRTVIDGRNVMDYYSQAPLDPEIPLDIPGIDAAIFLQALGMAHTPLSVGRHVITLDVKNTQPIPGAGIIEYHNTWNVTVKPAR